MRLIIVSVMAIVFVSCSSTHKQNLKQGIWRGVIEIQGKELPFNFEVKKDSVDHFNVTIKNADENLLLDEVSVKGDTVSMTLHIFDSQLKAKIHGDSLNGFFIKNSESNYRLPFKAAFGQDYRFTNLAQPDAPDFTGTYSTTFRNEKDTTIAVGIFTQKQNHVQGTFLTPTGDFRYLEGDIVNDSMKLSSFDGNSAYLFNAVKKNDSTLIGNFWSGKSWSQTWIGQRDEHASLPDASSLTNLKKGFNKIDFQFRDINGKLVSPSDDKYKNKVLIVQIMGTWCPNCMDETKFLTSWYKTNKSRGVEILALAYEAKADFTYATTRVKKMKEKLGITYDIVIAGTKDKVEASKTLPMLNEIAAFPTTIFVGKDGLVKKISTSFSGPGTGHHYELFVKDFNETVNELLVN